jgi:hypothetical protein
MSGEFVLQLPEELFEALTDAVSARLREDFERASKNRHRSGFLNVRSAAEYLDVTEDALRSRVKRREVPVHRRHGRLYFERAELDRYVRGEDF